jgi:hypothetical protein
MRTFERLLVIGLAIAVFGPATGCKQKINTKKAEKLMKEKLPEMLGADVEVKSVDCPDGIEAKKGETFECTAELVDGTKLNINVEQQDDEGNVLWSPDPWINTKQLTDSLTSTAKQNGVADATYDCGLPIQVIDLPGSIECKFTGGGESATLEAMLDKDANLVDLKAK